MRITMTRDDIREQAQALKHLELLENWTQGTQSHTRFVVLRQQNSSDSTTVHCGGRQDDRPGHGDEVIFRKHLDAAVSEAVAYWRDIANLSEEDQ